MRTHPVQNQTKILKRYVRNHPYRIASSVAILAGLGAAAYFAFRKLTEVQGDENVSGQGSIGTNDGYDTEFAGAYPRSSGAVSAVTGGHPEDMNDMPVTQEPPDGPVYRNLHQSVGARP